jgi:hypothetical protein
VELDYCTESWRVQYIGVVAAPGALVPKTAPGVLALKTVPRPLRQSLWTGPNTHAGGGPTAPYD